MMKVARMAHAGIVVTSRDALCVMDPVLKEPFDGSTFDPPIEVDLGAVPRRPDLLILSHAHSDHLSVSTLDVFDRDCPVAFPAGEGLIERTLRRMGFRQRRGLSAGQRFTVGDMELFPTPSRVDFAEMGVVFRARGRTCWNLVDTAVDEPIIAAVRQLAPRVDVLLAPYQPLVERPLWSDGLGSGFPHEAYGRLLRAVLDTRPRCVVPASCGFRFANEDWRNKRMFPLMEEQFLEDVAALDRDIAGRVLPPGAELTVGRGHPVKERALPFVHRRGPHLLAAHDWRPDQGVPPLVDENPSGYAVRTLRRAVSAYLGGELLDALSGPRHALWLERMKRLRVRWRLEVVYPGKRVERYRVDFTRQPLRLEIEAAAERGFAKVRTSITASGLQDLRVGRLSAYAAGGRVFRTALRLYEPQRDGVHIAGGPDDEPLTRTLLLEADAIHLERQLQSLGY